MSKFLLWAGFILSIFFLCLAASSVLFLRNTQDVKLWAVVLWLVILLGSGYKLFFAKLNR